EAALALFDWAPSLRVYGLAGLAQILLLSGDAGGALAPAKEALQGLEALGALDEGEALVHLVAAEALERSGDAPAARAAIATARDRLLARAARMADAERRRTFLENVPEHVRTLALA